MEKFEIEPYDKTNAQNRFEKEEAYLRAKKRLDKIVGFYWHLAVYIVVNVFLILIIASQRDDQWTWDFGTFSTAFFWGIGLGFHFLGVYGPNFLFGKSWEDRKIKEFMDKDEKNMKRFE